MPFVVTIISNAVGLLLAVYLLPRALDPESISWTGGFVELLIAGTVIGLINGVLRPLIKLLSLPLILLTAGLFGLVINIGLVWFADYLLADLTINGIVPLIATTIILATVHIVF